jgi:AGZA family xanthine/uracil permease-like MFS transporter
VLSFVGLIHGAKVGWDVDGQVALGYLFAAAVCLLFHFRKVPPRVPGPDEALLAEEGPATVEPEPAV